MRVDLRTIAGPVEELLPWDLQLSVDGETYYPTARPTVGDVAAMTGEDKAAQLAAVGRIFRAPAPDVAGWSGEQFAAAIFAYLAYFNERVSKNSPALLAAARRAVGATTTRAAAGSTSGASSST
jgi:hypothetical protein